MSDPNVEHEALLFRVHSGQLSPQDRADLGRLVDDVRYAVQSIEGKFPDKPHAAGYFKVVAAQYRRMVPREREPGSQR